MNALADDIQSGKKPRGKVRKPFRIECRFIRWHPANARFVNREWLPWRSYETARQRDAALESLIGKQSRRTYAPSMEFRAAGE